MAVTSNRSIGILMSGDFTFSQTVPAAQSGAAPGVIEKKNLSSGANTITVPSGSTGVTIKPPSGNTQVLTLKGVSGDTGISIHRTDPTSIGLNSVSTFVINAAATVNDVVFIWT